MSDEKWPHADSPESVKELINGYCGYRGAIDWGPMIDMLTRYADLLEQGSARIRELEAKLSTIERQTILRCADACEQRGSEFRGDEQFAEAFGCDDCAAMFRQEVRG